MTTWSVAPSGAAQAKLRIQNAGQEGEKRRLRDAGGRRRFEQAVSDRRTGVAPREGRLRVADGLPAYLEWLAGAAA